MTCGVPWWHTASSAPAPTWHQLYPPGLAQAVSSAWTAPLPPTPALPGSCLFSGEASTCPSTPPAPGFPPRVCPVQKWPSGLGGTGGPHPCREGRAFLARSGHMVPVLGVLRPVGRCRGFCPARAWAPSWAHSPPAPPPVATVAGSGAWAAVSVLGGGRVVAGRGLDQECVSRNAAALPIGVADRMGVAGGSLHACRQHAVASASPWRGRRGLPCLWLPIFASVPARGGSPRDELTLVCGSRALARESGGAQGRHHFSGKCEVQLRSLCGLKGGSLATVPRHAPEQARVGVPGPALRPVLSPGSLPSPSPVSEGLERGGWHGGFAVLTCFLLPRTCGTRWATCPCSGTMTSLTWAMTWTAGASISPCEPAMSWTSFWTRWTTLITGEPGGQDGGLGGLGAGL